MQPDRVLLLGCGALAKEMADVVLQNRLDHVTVECLPAKLHNTPAEIPRAVAGRLASGGYDRALIAYGDCGTAGALDAVLEEFGAERLAGAHCYEFFARSDVFTAIHDDDPRTFYLTDFLVRHFDRLVWAGLKLDRHPELLEAYFGNYVRVMYLSQFDSSDMVDRARRCADKLGLRFEHRHVGLGELETKLIGFSRAPRIGAGA
ncbi:MAG: DUF1638 domain-containing protein [Acidimicrobiia bacterium]